MLTMLDRAPPVPTRLSHLSGTLESCSLSSYRARRPQDKSPNVLRVSQLMGYPLCLTTKYPVLLSCQSTMNSPFLPFNQQGTLPSLPVCQLGTLCLSISQQASPLPTQSIQWASLQWLGQPPPRPHPPIQSTVQSVTGTILSTTAQSHACCLAQHFLDSFIRPHGSRERTFAPPCGLACHTYMPGLKVTVSKQAPKYTPVQTPGPL